MVEHLVNSQANNLRITHVQNCFGAFGQPLLVPGRVLVGEGELSKMCRKKLKQRQFFLFNDILVYGNIVIRKKQYVKQHIIPLEDVTLEDMPDTPGLTNGWVIKTPTKSFAVFAATREEKKEWIDHINKCVEDLLKRTGKQPSTEMAAVWIPDSEATVCMLCKKTAFSLLNRRHHCRKCGHVVCSSCSNQRFLIPTISSKPKRVCQSCFTQLSKERCSGGYMGTLDIETAIPTHKIISSSSEDSDDDDGKVPEVKEKPSPVEKPTFYSEEQEVAAGAGDSISSVTPQEDASSTDIVTRSKIGNLI